MIGSRIRELRTKQKLSLSELAKRAGVVKSYLSTIERGIASNPTIEVVNKIARALSVDQEVLLNFEKPHQEELITNNTLFYVEKKLRKWMRNNLMN